MVPILHSDKIRELDKQTLLSKGMSNLELIQQAVESFFHAFAFKKKKLYVILCGTGNNGADGLYLAKVLASKKIPHQVIILDYGNSHSLDFDALWAEWKDSKTIKNFKTHNEFEHAIEIIKSENQEIEIIECILGNGINKALKDDFKKTALYLNQINLPIYSIDMPMGLGSQAEQEGVFVRCTHCYTFEFGRLSLLNPENKISFSVVPIGINHPNPNESLGYILESQDVSTPKKDAFAHKYNHGHVLIIGGSKGMYGAPILSSLASYKSGAGLVSSLIPNQGHLALYSHLPEALALDGGEDKIVQSSEAKKNYQAIAVGPGLGSHIQTQEWLLGFLSEKPNSPLVLDADAINILSIHHSWSLIPPLSILTPHEGEFKRMVGSWANFTEKIQKLKDFAVKYQCIIVLKGKYSLICDNRGELFFNIIGSISLATAGSGDILTGLIAGYLAQGFSPLFSAQKAVWEHGKAGFLANGKNLLARELLELV